MRPDHRWSTTAPTCADVERLGSQWWFRPRPGDSGEVYDVTAHQGRVYFDGSRGDEDVARFFGEWAPCLDPDALAADRRAVLDEAAKVASDSQRHHEELRAIHRRHRDSMGATYHDGASDAAKSLAREIRAIDPSILAGIARDGGADIDLALAAIDRAFEEMGQRGIGHRLDLPRELILRLAGRRP